MKKVCRVSKPPKVITSSLIFSFCLWKANDLGNIDAGSHQLSFWNIFLVCFHLYFCFLSLCFFFSLNFVLSFYWTIFIVSTFLFAFTILYVVLLWKCFLEQCLLYQSQILMAYHVFR